MPTLDELIKALKGSNITINIQGGTGNVMNTGPTYNDHRQDNRRISIGSSRSAARCSICGGSDGDDLYAHAFGTYTHQSCLREQGRAERARHHHEQINQPWSISRSPDAPTDEVESPLMIDAPKKKYLDELLARSDLIDLLNELQRNASAERERERQYARAITIQQQMQIEKLADECISRPIDVDTDWVKTHSRR